MLFTDIEKYAAVVYRFTGVPWYIPWTYTPSGRDSKKARRRDCIKGPIVTVGITMSVQVKMLFTMTLDIAYGETCIKNTGVTTRFLYCIAIAMQFYI